MRNYCFYTYLILLISNTSCTKKGENNFIASDINIIPKVASVQINSEVFQFDENTKFVISNENQIDIAQILIDKFKTVSNWDLEITRTNPKENYIIFKTDKKLKKEAYELQVTKTKVIVTAASFSGFLYGIESLRQLLPVAIESKNTVETINWEIPNLVIKDFPRFKWRGLMLDVSRHFFQKEYIKKTIDRLALHKMNILHLHLIDDQGWRIEIKKYPKLTEIGAWRVDQEDVSWNYRKPVTPNQKATYGGFLTQQELKEIVAYAERKGVEVIPEIEMPAHVSSAIAAYPALACFNQKIGVPSGKLWPITDIYCAGKEYTFQFLEDVLTEVMEIFPSKYIHIGGDEATKTNWKKCPYCKKRMQTEKLHDVEELQSYFIQRVEKFINVKGKKLIGWDEILEGGLAPDATVMSWRGTKGGVEAAKQGHDVVMSPTSHSYFDHYQGPKEKEPLAIGGFTPLHKVYDFDPIVPTMSAKEAQHVLGGQANLWSEFIPTEHHSEYMIFPRLTAMSEALWAKKSAKNWNDFSNRLQTMQKRFELLDINYAKSSYIIKPKIINNDKHNSVSLVLANEHPSSAIKYTLQDEALTVNSKNYMEPIPLTETTKIKASVFSNNALTGFVFTDTIQFHKAIGATVNYTIPYSNRYKGSGKSTLINTLRGTKNFRDGNWQAWLNTSVEFIINLNELKSIKKVMLSSMQNQKNGIFYPTKLEILTSKDGKEFNKLEPLTISYQPNIIPELKTFIFNLNAETEIQFIKCKASFFSEGKNIKEYWLFFDEIIIE